MLDEPMQRNNSDSTERADTGGFRLADDASYPPIEDYGALGDGHSIALVSHEGSIDWLCLPHFSSPPLFAALLDRQRGGRFALRPSQPFRTKRQYALDTNVLERRFETESGSAQLTECMALLPSQRHGDTLRPQAEILRVLRGCEGHVDFEMI
jgi:GH15 family glucan-1,4-alpha-glucosidase